MKTIIKGGERTKQVIKEDENYKGEELSRPKPPLNYKTIQRKS